MPRRALPVLLVLAAAVLPYVPALDDYFVQDDFGVIVALADKPLSYFPWWFTNTWMQGVWGYTPDEIRPFPALSYQIAALWGAASPVANHAINVALHAVNAWLVLALARTAMGLAAGPATFAALVFALLPMQTESVAWVTGRVDSMPACFYLACVLCYVRWRASGSRAMFAWSITFCFAALFTKQNAVTLCVALPLYDLVVLRLPARPAWRSIRPYVPFVLLTAGYLALRYALFGEVAREGMLNAERVGLFLGDLSTHFRRMVYGEPGLRMSLVRAVGYLLTGLAAVTAVSAWRGDGSVSRLARPAAYFVVIWTALAMAPTLVAGYASPRHAYLASSGWALLLGVALEACWHVRPAPLVRRLAVALAAVVIVAYAWLLVKDVDRWGRRAALSRQAQADIVRETAQVPRGTLIVAGAPRTSWDFSLPHALGPPFTSEDLTARVSVISHSSLHCCPAHVWEPYTRERLRTWAADPSRPPVIAFHWDEATGTASRASDADDPFLRNMALWLLDTPGVADLDRRILEITDRFATVRR
jgi:hypothetical protein